MAELHGRRHLRAVSSINRPMLTVFANQHGGVHATSSVLAAKAK